MQGHFGPSFRDDGSGLCAAGGEDDEVSTDIDPDVTPVYGPPPSVESVKSVAEIREKISQHKDNLRLWRSGYLRPTEPDEDEVQLTMAGLKGAIYSLEWALGLHS